MRVNFFSGLVLAAIAVGESYAVTLGEIEAENSFDWMPLPDEQLAAQTSAELFRRKRKPRLIAPPKPVFRGLKPLAPLVNPAKKQARKAARQGKQAARKMIEAKKKQARQKMREAVGAPGKDMKKEMKKQQAQKKHDIKKLSKKLEQKYKSKYEKKILEKEKRLEAREIQLKNTEEELRNRPPPAPTIIPVPVPTPVAMPVKDCQKPLVVNPVLPTGHMANDLIGDSLHRLDTLTNDSMRRLRNFDGERMNSLSATLDDQYSDLNHISDMAKGALDDLQMLTPTCPLCKAQTENETNADSQTETAAETEQEEKSEEETLAQVMGNIEDALF